MQDGEHASRTSAEGSAARPEAPGPPDVARYYDQVQWLYDLGWSPGGTHSLHYGLWWDDTRSLAEAVRNGDRFIADKLAVQRSDHVLDMGCGVGGTSVFLAKTYGCRVTGITISRVQIDEATAHAKRSGVSELVRFELMDYTRMTFPEASFTKAFTQETANHALDKRTLLEEARRVLVPGGRYASLDAFQRRDARPGDEATRLERVLSGWPGGALVSHERYVALAKDVGLDVIESGDLTERTNPSADVIWRRHVYLYPFVRAARALGLVPESLLLHFQASIEQREMYRAEDNVLMFGFLVATKPT